MRKLLLLIAALGSPAWAYADGCRYSKDYDFNVDASAIENLIVDVGSGKLTIIGDDSIDEVQVEARACTNSRSRLNDLDLTHRSRGSDLLLRSEFHESGSLFSWLSIGYAYIDIELTVPSALLVEVDDGSGAINISGVSAVELKDGSGSIRISDISGDVSVDDGSGAITVYDVNGVVSINDGSGNVKISDSNGVNIIDDGSGSIQIENINSNVTVHEDGSGSISIHNVGGDVDIGDSGSGSINVSAIAGNYTAKDD